MERNTAMKTARRDSSPRLHNQMKSKREGSAHGDDMSLMVYRNSDGFDKGATGGDVHSIGETKRASCETSTDSSLVANMDITTG